LPSLDEIKKIHSKAINLRNFYINRNNKNSGFFARLIEKASVLGIVKFTQVLKENVLDSKNLPFICSAGKNIFVLEPEGGVRLCELHKIVGNLRDYNYDINRLLKNKKARKLFEFIKNCRCTHVCFLNMSIANSKKSLIKIPYYFLRWKK
jgi:MoaA/NifB/PqqE/SkfB family radical SAM enzyme